MKVLKSVSKSLGLDIEKEKYAYDIDEQFGFMSKSRIPDKWIKTTCGYCSVGCGMYIGVKGDRAVSVKGDPNHPVNEGRLCPKGLAEHHSIHLPNRAKYPLLKSSKKKFKRIDWDWAVREMVGRFKTIQDKYGKESVGVISTGQMVTEEFYALGKLVQLGFGTNNFDGNTTLCMASAVAGYKRSFGSDGPPGSYEDLEKSDLVFLMGANIADNHPILCYRLEKNQNKKVIVVDPRVTKTAMLADHYLPVKPRSDIALINGIINGLIELGMVDDKYIAANTTGFEELKSHVKDFTIESVCETTGLSEESLIKTIQMIAKAKRPFFAWTMGVNHSTQGTETVNAICNLSLLLGQVGQVGASPFSITGQCNAMGTRETGFTSSLPGYRKFESDEDREELANLWGVENELVPTQRGLAYPDIIEGVISGKIKGLWIIATNPLVSFPNQNYLRDALDRLDFLVVQDGYHPIPTSEIADLVLPAAIWGEKEGTYTNSERRVSKVNKAVTPPGEAMPDFDIFLKVAEELGVKDKIYPGWTEPKDAFEEWKKVSEGRLCDYSGMTYEMIEKHGGVQWPLTRSEVKSGTERGSYPGMTTRLYQDGKFSTKSGKAKFWTINNDAPPEVPNKEFPFWLNTGRTVEHWHTGTKTRGIKLLNRLSPEAWLEMNPRDARKMKLTAGDYGKVISRRGTIERIIVRVTETVAPGQIFIPFHFAEANANNLTVNDACPISREPNYKQAAVRIEKSDAPLLGRQ